MSLSPHTFAEARANFKPMRRSPMKKRRPAKKRAKRAKVPSTNKVKKIFSDMVRERAGWKCVRCGRDCSERKGLLHCSHFWAVGFTATRFDFDNCDALCYVCHYGQMRTGWEYNKQGEYRDFMIKKLGQEGYDELERKARTPLKLLEAKTRFIESIKPDPPVLS